VSIGVLHSPDPGALPLAGRISGFPKNPGVLDADFVYVGISNIVEISYALRSAKISQKSPLAVLSLALYTGQL